ncbi:MAG: glycosyltransferase family 2 protein [Cytophagales bacterium]|nr:glycosyltransferase family 2 protein [Armatimonadota bacterium]
MSEAPGTLPVCDVVIVNWNAGPQLVDCLRALSRCDRSDYHLRQITIVDNASTDHSLQEVERADLGISVRILRNADNKGFAAACNQGARGGDAEFLLFLNPDTVAFPESLSVPLSFLQSRDAEQIGIVGISLIDDRGQPARNACRFPTPGLFLRELLGLHQLFPKRFPGHVLLDWPHDETRIVDHVIGAFYLVRRHVFAALGGFDERFFVYKEDLDFSLRAQQSGWQSCYLATARAYHKGGGTSEGIKARRLFYGLRSRVQYGFKHFGWPAAVGLLLATLLLEPVARIVRALLMRSGDTLWETLGGIGRLWLWAIARPFQTKTI